MSIMSILRKKRVLVVSVFAFVYQTVTSNIASGQGVTDFQVKGMSIY